MSQGWRIDSEAGRAVMRFDLLSDMGVRHGIAVRDGGRDIDEEGFYRRLAGLGPTVVTEQTHSTKTALVGPDFTDFYPARIEVDGLMSIRTGATLTVHTADCVPVYLAAGGGRAVGLFHCGWRGTAGGFLKQAVAGFWEKFGAASSELVLVIGPCVCRECYPVGPEVAARFGPVVKKEIDGGRWLLDLRAENLRQALEAGIPEANIQVSALCTRCRPDLFHSYRREGAGLGGKMVAFIEAGHEEE